MFGRNRTHHSETTADSAVLERGRARANFGGLDFAAGLVGMLVSVAMLLLLGGIVSAIAGTQLEYADALNNIQEATAVAAIVSLLMLVAAFMVGGWAAGRMARFDGVANGLLVAVLTILAAVGIGVFTAWLGDQYNLIPNVSGLTGDIGQYTEAGVLGAVLALAAIFLSAALGGYLGQRYHERVDDDMVAAPVAATTTESRTVTDGTSADDADVSAHRVVRRRD